MRTTLSYRRDDMRADAAARGWNLVTWFRRAGVTRWNGYKFMQGASSASATAEALTNALGKRRGFYLVRKRRVAA